MVEADERGDLNDATFSESFNRHAMVYGDDSNDDAKSQVEELYLCELALKAETKQVIGFDMCQSPVVMASLHPYGMTIVWSGCRGIRGCRVCG